MRATLFAIMILTLMVPRFCWARSELDTRVTRLENIVANELNIKLLQQLDQMQQEISELRGKLEEQQNSVSSLNQKQEKLFLNLDERLNKLNPQATEQAPQTSANNEVVTQSATPPQNATEQTILHNTSEKGRFDAAQALMHARQYPQAIVEFKDLLWQFPEGDYAVQAYYWLGELYAMQWRETNKSNKDLLKEAIEAFTIVTNKYAGQDLEGDALLKLALLEMDQDHLAVAKDILQQVVKKFPNTARSLIAENNIARIEQVRISN